MHTKLLGDRPYRDYVAATRQQFQAPPSPERRYTFRVTYTAEITISALNERQALERLPLEANKRCVDGMYVREVEVCAGI